MKTAEEILAKYLSVDGKFVMKDFTIDAMKEYAGQERGWISVEDRLPPPPKYPYAWYEIEYNINVKGSKVASAFYSGRCWRFNNGKTIELYGVTHWMPLPEPPSTNAQTP